MKSGRIILLNVSISIYCRFHVRIWTSSIQKPWNARKFQQILRITTRITLKQILLLHNNRMRTLRIKMAQILILIALPQLHFGVQTIFHAILVHRLPLSLTYPSIIVQLALLELNLCKNLVTARMQVHPLKQSNAKSMKFLMQISISANLQILIEWDFALQKLPTGIQWVWAVNNAMHKLLSGTKPPQNVRIAKIIQPGTKFLQLVSLHWRNAKQALF